jgi:hypothetical protein
MSSEAPNTDTTATIVCPLAKWYYWRIAKLAGMFIAFSALFFYDWMIGYPNENKVADEKEWFENTVQKGYDAAKAAGEEQLGTWMAEAKKNGWVQDLKATPRWDAYAAMNNKASNPERKSQDAIDQQLHFGLGLLAGAVISGIILLMNMKKTFVGHADHMVMPDGKKVMYADVFKVDKRKWDNKALAYAYYRTAADGPIQKAVIDDLKFDGSGKVFDRLMANFSGELIEKLPDPEDADEETPSASSAGASEQHDDGAKSS